MQENNIGGQQESGLAIKDLILTVHGAKKIFLIWCCIGLILGIITAGAYYIIQKNRAVTGDVSAEIRLNYPGAESDAGAFSEVIIWENALKAIGRNDISAADAMSQVTVIKDEPAQDMPANELNRNAYVLTISSGSKIFISDSAKKEFLNALCKSYKKYITDKYYNRESAGMLHGQHLKTWLNSCRTIIWDPLCFGENFSMLSGRYLILAAILEDLYAADPDYRMPDGKSFGDCATEFRESCDKDIADWTARLDYKIYIRNIDRFKEEARYNIDTMKMNRERCLKLLDSYNKLLASFPEKDIQETADILAESRFWSDRAAELYYKIGRMEYNLETLGQNEPGLRENSVEAEKALASFIDDLERRQETLRQAIYDYYAQKNSRAAENSVIYTAAFIILPDGDEALILTRVLLIFAALSFAGAAIGFFAAYVKRYIPENGNEKKDKKITAVN